MSILKLLKFISFILVSVLYLSIAKAATAPNVYVLEVNGAISPAIAEYIDNGLNSAKKNQADAIILQLDTPGGLDKSMRDIIKDILDSPIPVITYVAPKGAHAASAGTFILYASHIAAMAPGTNLGAASPISLMPTQSDDKKTNDTSHKKVMADAIAYITSLAELRDRNKQFAIQAVQDAKSITANQALKENVINYIAPNIEDLLKQVNGSKVKLDDNTVTLNTTNAHLVYYQADWRVKLLSIITDPSIAYVLLIVGLYGLLFEFFHPGALLPGVVGGLCLIMALYALQMLPISYAGLALIILGIIFFVSELFIPSFGALGIGGTIAFIIGSIMLMDTNIPTYGIPWQLIALMTVINGIVLGTLIFLVLRARRRPKQSGSAVLIGHHAHVIGVNDDGSYWVMINGERWRAHSREELKLQQEVVVKAMHGLELEVVGAAPFN